jgi:hypothetical protein
MLTTRKILFGAGLVLAACGCVGPGLEPPGNQQATVGSPGGGVNPPVISDGGGFSNSGKGTAGAAGGSRGNQSSTGAAGGSSTAGNAGSTPTTMPSLDAGTEEDGGPLK